MRTAQALPASLPPDLYYNSSGAWSPDRLTPFLLLGQALGHPHRLPPSVSNLIPCSVAPAVLPHILVQDLLTVLWLFITLERISPTCQLFLLWLVTRQTLMCHFEDPQLGLPFPDLGGQRLSGQGSGTC